MQGASPPSLRHRATIREFGGDLVLQRSGLAPLVEIDRIEHRPIGHGQGVVTYSLKDRGFSDWRVCNDAGFVNRCSEPVVQLFVRKIKIVPQQIVLRPNQAG